jgi:predicted ribosomally synthesized peptide with nif11-like leader
MSEEQLKAFLEKVKADTSLQEKLKKAETADAIAEIAKAAGFMISANDIQNTESSPEALSDEELEGVAGGAEWTHWDNFFLCQGPTKNADTLNANKYPQC